ncbi:MAG: PAS domain S-box protein [Anaerolineae bacterium]|nr:PAS domain S-box protein [Anaerolineae bacterium]
MRLDECREPLIGLVKQALADMLYSHRSYLRPSEIDHLAATEVDRLFGYLKSGNEAPIREHAVQRAAAGLNLQAVLKVFAAVERYAHTDPGCTALHVYLTAIGAYRDVFLEHFINQREAVILTEQERIRAALQGSLSRYNLWLQTATEVSRAATSTLDLQHLIRGSVEIIRSNFEFYHVGLYLVDAERNCAELGAGSGSKPPGVPYDQPVMIDDQTSVGWCILHGEAKTTASVQAEELRSDHTLLPETRSLMALPLLSRRQTIGAILIQSAQSSAFYDDDIARLQTVADQLANAIENARLYHELRVRSQNLANAVSLRTAELQATKERVEAILNNSPDAILLLREDGCIELCNPAFYEMFGYADQEIAGKPLASLIEVSQGDILTALTKDCLRSGQARNSGIVAQRKGGATFDAGIALASIRQLDTLTGFVCTVRDITEQVQAAERIKASLREKEVLLQEIHHRVKNNMQVISSLLALQAGYVSDEQVDVMFRESQNRIRSMALVHEQLYRSQDLARIDVGNYIKELTANLMHSYRTAMGRVHLEVRADPLYFDIDVAIPCGLIINELVSNSLKHAFPEGKNGHIVVEIRLDANGQHTLIVRDDGVGFPETLNVYKTETLGLQLVTSLTAQLNGTVGLQKGNGTTFEIRFAGRKGSPPDAARPTTGSLIR